MINQPSDLPKTPRQEGYEAGLTWAGVLKCPYDQDCHQYSEWMLGYKEGADASRYSVTGAKRRAKW